MELLYEKRGSWMSGCGYLTAALFVVVAIRNAFLPIAAIVFLLVAAFSFVTGRKYSKCYLLVYSDHIDIRSGDGDEGSIRVEQYQIVSVKPTVMSIDINTQIKNFVYYCTPQEAKAAASAIGAMTGTGR